MMNFCNRGGHHFQGGMRHGMRRGGWGQHGSGMRDGWDHRDRGGRGGGRRLRMFDSGELHLVLLKLIADEARHGYDLIREMERLTGGAYAPSPGVVYPTLTLLADMGAIEERQVEGSRKQFAITAAGREQLEDNKEQVEALISRLVAVGEEHKRMDATSVRRAMGNLREVLMNRLTSGVEDKALNDIVALIDEAAQKIERL